MNVNRMDEWLTRMAPYRGRIAGTLFGLLFGIVFLIVGFWRTLFFIFLVLMGYYFGHKIDKREDLVSIVFRILPEKFFKQKPPF